MTNHSPSRWFWAILCLIAGQSWAGPSRLSEKLTITNQKLTAPMPEPQAQPGNPLRLKVDADIHKSIIHELVIPTGTSMLGTSYRLGSNSNTAVDCSALVQQMYRRAGVELPRDTKEMVAVGVPVGLSAVEPGDLLFYRWTRHQLHVVVYAGEGFVLHASTGEHKVVMRALNRTWGHHLVAARRLMQTQGVSVLSARESAPLI